MLELGCIEDGAGPPPVSQCGHLKVRAAAKPTRIDREEGAAEDDAHYRTCQADSCSHCKYIRMQRKWCAKLPFFSPSWQVDDSRDRTAMPNTWLDRRLENGKFVGVGCIACAAMLRKNPDWAGLKGARSFSTFSVTGVATLQLSNMIRHQLLTWHKRAIFAYAGICQKDDMVNAPSPDDFMRVWDHVGKGMAPSAGLPGVGKAKKIVKMLYCLHEGIAILDRDFCRSAESMSLRRDERAARISIRMAVTNAGLETRTGVFGIAINPGTGATATTAATAKLFEEFCTPYFGAPGKTKLVPSDVAVDQELLNKLKQMHRQLIVDAVAYESLSGRQMEAGQNFDSQDILTPNQKLVSLDVAHGSRRLLSRTFRADEYMAWVLDNFIMMKTTLPTIIRNSQHIRQIFQELVEALTPSETTAGSTSNLGVAKHRFDSMSKRLGRAVAKWVAMIKLAEWLRINRAGKVEAAHAQWFLLNFDAEPLLMMALMSDAADEGYCLTTFCDSERVDCALMSSEVTAMVQHCDYLFMQEGVFKVDGFTPFALQSWKVVRSVNARRDEVRSLGSPLGMSQEIIDRCLGRMKSWYVLMRIVCRTEFPEYENLQAFSIFNLYAERKDSRTTLHNKDSAQYKETVGRVARLADVDEEQLLHELGLHKPIAANICDQNGCTNKEAWRLCLSKTQTKASTRARYPAAALRPALIAYGNFGASSSGVEQGFSKVNRMISKQQLGSCRSILEKHLTKIILDRRPDETEQVVQHARQVWMNTYGEHRTGPVAGRMDKGIKRKQTDSTTPQSEIGWLRRRRKQVLTCAAGSARAPTLGADQDEEGPAEGSAGSAFWGEAHKAEMDFQLAKQLKSKAYKMKKGLLLDSDMADADERQAAEEFLQHQAGQDAKNAAESRRSKARSTAKTFAFEGKVVYLDEDIISRDLRERLMTFRGATVATQRKDADVFVVQDPSKVSRRIEWACFLKGGALVTPQLVMKGEGSVVAFKPVVISTSRHGAKKLWISDSFAAEAPALSAIIKGIIGQGNFNWKLLPTYDTFDTIRGHGAAANKQKRWTVVGLATRQETVADPRLMTAETFAGHFKQLDRMRCRV